MKIAIGCDHGGFDLKEKAKQVLEDKGHQVTDCGTFDKESVDYPDFAAAVARAVSTGVTDRGVVVCTSGIGVSITANKFPGVRAALCLTDHMAEMSRKHNNANVLALGQALTEADTALTILDTWLHTEFEGGRHERRVNKIDQALHRLDELYSVRARDEEIYEALKGEHTRQETVLNLLAGENTVSRAVRDAQQSTVCNKYAGGYPGQRNYPDCRFVDTVEQLARDRARLLFGGEHVNVQPHSGAGANLAVLMTVLNSGDRILSMDPTAGGLLTHGRAGTCSGRLYDTAYYGVDPETELLDMTQLKALAAKHKPRMIIAGGSGYSRMLDYKKLRKIADSVGAYLMADIAHTAGLVAAGCQTNPVPHCEFVTMSTHKSLRGPRGGMVICQSRFAAELDRCVQPGLQGAPQANMLAAKAVAFSEALQPAFKQYQEQVVRNAKALAGTLEEQGWRIISSGTDNHLLVTDTSGLSAPARDICQALEKCGILTSRFPVPGNPPEEPTGIRMGTLAVTTAGMDEAAMETIGKLIIQAAQQAGNKEAWPDIRHRVRQFLVEYC